MLIRRARDVDSDLLQTYSRVAWDNPDSADYLNWRYRVCVVLDGVVAISGDACVASMFALRRSYQTRSGAIDCLEPLEWYAAPEFRALGAGLRVVRQLMRDGRPLISLGGTTVARELMKKLQWSQEGVAARYILPLRGRFLRHRGHGVMTSAAFEAAFRYYYSPSRTRHNVFTTERVESFPTEAGTLVAEQARFALAPVPEDQATSWLFSAPPLVGQYQRFLFRRNDIIAGWALTRVYRESSTRFGSILHLFLADSETQWYQEAVTQVSAALMDQSVDAITAITSCPETIVALRKARFRLDDTLPVLVWWGDTPRHDGPVLATGIHADYSFFPLASSTT